MGKLGTERRKVVLSLVGKQGAGKTTLGKKLARYLDTKQVEVSDVVREKAHLEYDKKELAKTAEKTQEDPNWLGEAVYEELLSIYNDGKRSAVLTGAREVEVHAYLKKRGLYIVGCDVVASPDVRYRRLRNLGKIKSAKDFIDQEIREQNLGLLELMSESRYEIPTSYNSDPDQLVRALVAQITKKNTALR